MVFGGACFCKCFTRPSHSCRNILWWFSTSTSSVGRSLVIRLTSVTMRAPAAAGMWSTVAGSCPVGGRPSRGPPAHCPCTAGAVERGTPHPAAPCRHRRVHRLHHPTLHRHLHFRRSGSAARRFLPNTVFRPSRERERQHGVGNLMTAKEIQYLKNLTKIELLFNIIAFHSTKCYLIIDQVAKKILFKFLHTRIFPEYF